MANLDDYLRCRLHNDIYINPRQLPHCGHVFCLPCLKRLPTTLPNHIECPICRSQQRLPDSGLDGLRLDTTSYNIIQNLTCGDCGTVANTTKECKACKSKYCANCIGSHGDPHLCIIVRRIREVKEVVYPGDFDANAQRTRSFLLQQFAAVEKYRTHTNAKIESEFQLLRTLKRMVNENLDDVSAELRERLKSMDIVENVKEQVDDLSEMISEGNAKALKNNLQNIDKLHKAVTNPKLLKTDDSFEVHRLYDLCVDQSQVHLFDYAGRRHCMNSDAASVYHQPHDMCIDPTDDSLYVCDERTVTKCKLSTYPVTLKHQHQWDTDGPTLCHITDRQEILFIDTGSNMMKLLGTKYKGRLLTKPSDPLTSLTSFKDSDYTTVYVSTSSLIYRFRLDKKLYKSNENQDIRPAVLNEDRKMKGISDMVMDKNGYLFVVPTDQHLIVVINTRNGDYMAELTTAGGVQLNYPTSVCIDIFGWVLVADSGNRCIHVYRRDLTHYDSIRDVKMQFILPKRVRVDRMKRIFVLDSDREKVMLF